MNRINIMDCTLRDGGWVNGFAFGKEIMQDILITDQIAGAEYVELGYLDQAKGSYHDKSMYANVAALEECFENVRKTDTTIRMVMIDYGKFDADKLPKIKKGEANVIDGIRLCFHKKNLAEAVEYGKQVLSKGYELFIQPMVISRYSEEDLKEMIELFQKEVPGFSAFYIVDSFGVMDEKEACDKLMVADKWLEPEIMLGLHTHNNRNLSFEIAKAACQMIHKERCLLFDCTLDGLGKGPGNLVMEEITEYLNENEGKNYNLEKIKALSERCINPMRKMYEWGYAPEFEMSSKYAVTSTYARVFCREYNRSLKELEVFLSGMPENKKDSFDRKYLEEYIRKTLQK